MEEILNLNPKQEQLGKIYDMMILELPYETFNYPIFKVEEDILKWNLVRGNIDFDAVASAELYEEEMIEYDLAKEQFDDAKDCSEKKPALYAMVDAECDKFVVMTGILAKSGRADIVAPLVLDLADMYEDYKGIPKRLKELGFNFVKCMEQCLMEINSREQDVEQKLLWESGQKEEGQKWKKNLNQNPDTLYKADYEKCRLDNCGCK